MELNVIMLSFFAFGSCHVHVFHDLVRVATLSITPPQELRAYSTRRQQAVHITRLFDPSGIVHSCNSTYHPLSGEGL